MKTIVVWKEKGTAYADHRNNTARYHFELYRLINGGTWREGNLTFVANLPDRVDDKSLEIMRPVFTQVEDYAENSQASESRPQEAFEICKEMNINPINVGLEYVFDIFQKNYIPYDVFVDMV